MKWYVPGEMPAGRDMEPIHFVLAREGKRKRRGKVELVSRM